MYMNIIMIGVTYFILFTAFTVHNTHTLSILGFITYYHDALNSHEC